MNKFRCRIFTLTAVLLAAAFILQGVIFYVSVHETGVIETINSNSVDFLSSHAEKFSTYIEKEMTKRSSPIEGYADAVNANLEKVLSENNKEFDDIYVNTELRNEFLELSAEDLLTFMKTNTVNGAYIMICNNKGEQYKTESAVYNGVSFVDTDLENSDPNYSDIIMDVGNSTISSRYNIPLSMRWRPYVAYNDFTKDLLASFFKPVDAIYASPGSNSADYGGWTIMTKNSDESGTHIDEFSYSMPLVYQGEAYGVIGVTVFTDVIGNMIVSDSEYESDEYYVLMAYDENDGVINADIKLMFGELAEENIIVGDRVVLKENADAEGLYETEGLTINGSNACCTFENIDVYSANTLFYSEKWALAAVTSERNVFGVSNNFYERLVFMFVCQFVMAVIFTFTLSYMISSSMKRLVESSEGKSEDNAFYVTEMQEISDKIASISEERDKYRADLLAERERYLILMQTSSYYLMEYDNLKDAFTVYHFDDKDTNYDSNKHHTYHNYRQMVADGIICTEDSMSDMIRFLNGEFTEPVVMKLYAGRNTKEHRWFNVNSRSIYDSNGRLLRVVATASDVTEEKLEEMKRIDIERHDPVSGFYNSEYGTILVQRDILEKDAPYSLGIISISGTEDFIGEYGAYCYDALLEEVSNIIRHYVKANEDEMVWRIKYSGFAIYIPGKDREEYNDRLQKMVEYIQNIYHAFDSDMNSITCHIGISQNEEGMPYEEALIKAKRAYCAAKMPQYPNVVYYYEMLSDVEARAAFMKYQDKYDYAYNNQFNSGFAITDNIIMYAINMLEKTKRLEAAMCMIFCKAGRMFNMRRIVSYELNSDFGTIRASIQWNDYGLEYIESRLMHISEDEISKLTDIFAGTDIITVDKNFYVSSNAVMDVVNDVRGDGISYISLVSEKNEVMGFLAFAAGEDGLSQEECETIKELTKIIKTYIIKSKTTLESRAKSDFLSRMSHEIRTPMNAIMGMTAIVLGHKENMTSEVENCLKKIDVSSKYLLSLINDILDMSKIESGKMTIENICFSLEEVIGRIETIISVQTAAKGIRFDINMNITNALVMGDPLKLNQVLMNIIGNAVKFTDRGGITLTVVEAETATPDLVSVYFSVRDTGIGIKKENLAKIFNSFEQEDVSTTRRYGGTGLGLAISSNLVGMLGGKLEVESEEGSGSTFFFTLPYKLAGKDMLPDGGKEKKAVDFNNKTILLAEDDELNVEIAATLLGREGMKVESAENGKVAVEKFEASESGYYDAILMDIRMPVMDGLDAAKNIRRSSHPDAKKIPIVAMTANAFDEDMKKSVESGMNGHLSKPIDMNKVREILAKIWQED